MRDRDVPLGGERITFVRRNRKRPLAGARLPRALPAAAILAAAVGCASDASLVQSVCDAFAACGQDTTGCEEALAPALALVPDPAKSTRCVSALPCAELLGRTEEAIARCVDVDKDSLVCSGSTLHVCDHAGSCTDVDCNDACEAAGASFLSCTQEDGHDQCGCVP
jgi:hypothetical protein